MIHEEVHHFIPVFAANHIFIVLRIFPSVPSVNAEQNRDLNGSNALQSCSKINTKYLMNIVPVIVNKHRSTNVFAHILFAAFDGNVREGGGKIRILQS